jgi:hypothetical protein
MNKEIGTEAAQFPEKKYINGIFLAVQSAASPVSLNLLTLLDLFSSPSSRGAMHQIRVFHNRKAGRPCSQRRNAETSKALSTEKR